MDKRIAQIINSYILYLQKENFEFKKVYLFGSYAKNKQTEHSDIDLAFIFDGNNSIDFFDLQAQMLSLASYIDTRIEPHPISTEDFTSENPLACEILNTGMEII